MLRAGGRLRMNPRPFVRRALLVLAITALNVSSAGLAVVSDFPAPQVVFAYALLFAEVGLIAIWSGLSAMRWWVRAAGHLAVFAAAVTATESMHGNAGGWFLLFTLQSVSITGPLLLARFAGIRLARSIDVAHGVRLQFTLRHLFIGMTTCAVLLGIGRALYPVLRSGSRPARNVAFEACLLGIGFASVALIATWVALGTGGKSVKLLVFVIAMVAVGILFAAIEPGTPVAIITMVILQATMLTSALAAFRRAGYRLMRLRDRASRSEAAVKLQ